MSENLPKRRIQISLTDEQLTQIQRVAKEIGVSKSSIIAMSVSDWIARREIQKNAMKM